MAAVRQRRLYRPSGAKRLGTVDWDLAKRLWAQQQPRLPWGFRATINKGR